MKNLAFKWNKEYPAGAKTTICLRRPKKIPGSSSKKLKRSVLFEINSGHLALKETKRNELVTQGVSLSDHFAEKHDHKTHSNRVKVKIELRKTQALFIGDEQNYCQIRVTDLSEKGVTLEFNAKGNLKTLDMLPKSHIEPLNF
ncbi:MAG: hypothetical protein AAF204_04505 [Pseudomonadota bacterium]